MNVPFTTNKRYLGTDIRFLEEATLGELEMIDLASQKWYAFHDSESGNPFYLDAFSGETCDGRHLPSDDIQGAISAHVAIAQHVKPQGCYEGMPRSLKS